MKMGLEPFVQTTPESNATYASLNLGVLPYPILAIQVICAAGEGMVFKPLGLVKGMVFKPLGLVKGMVFKPLGLVEGLVIIENWSSIGSRLMGSLTKD